MSAIKPSKPSANKLAISLSLSLSIALAAVNLDTNMAFAADDKLPFSAEEIVAKRQALREKTMLPSLSGIKSLSYRVVGFKNSEALEKLMGVKLSQLSLPSHPVVKMEELKKGCEAIVQVSFARVASSLIAELKVTQWVSLLRSPDKIVRAVTYSNKLYLADNKAEQAVEELTNQFVIDFLKANQKDFKTEAGDAKKNPSQSSNKKK